MTLDNGLKKFFNLLLAVAFLPKMIAQFWYQKKQTEL